MKSSGAVNRSRQLLAQARHSQEAAALPRHLANLPPKLAKRAQELMDLVVHGILQDPDQQSSEVSEEEP